MAKRILVLTGASSYNVLTAMSASLARAFDQHGFEAVMVRADPARVEQSVQTALPGGRFDAVFAFASFGAEASSPAGGSIYDQEGTPYIGWNVDHPCYHYSRVFDGSAVRRRICANASHGTFVRYALRETRSRCAEDTTLLPGADLQREATPWRLRKSEVLVAATWLGPPQRWWATAAGTPAYDLIDGLVSRLAADRELNVLEAFRATTADLGVELKCDASTFRVIGEVLSYVRRVDRIAVVSALCRSGLPCTLVGSGWPSEIVGSPRLSIAPTMDFEALQQHYGNYKVVLNLNAANGACERALGAMARGAAVVSDDNQLLREAFFENGGLKIFDRSKPQDVVAAVAELLKGPEGQSVAETGRDLVSRGHGWDTKASLVARALGLC